MALKVSFLFPFLLLKSVTEQTGGGEFHKMAMLWIGRFRGDDKKENESLQFNLVPATENF